MKTHNEKTPDVTNIRDFFVINFPDSMELVVQDVREDEKNNLPV